MYMHFSDAHCGWGIANSKGKHEKNPCWWGLLIIPTTTIIQPITPFLKWMDWAAYMVIQNSATMRIQTRRQGQPFFHVILI